MAIVKVKVERYKGEYPLESDRPMDAFEWRLIKKISGYMPMTIDAGFAGDDPDLYIALAVIALLRAGKIRKEEALLAAAIFDSAPVSDESFIVLDFSDETEKEELAAVSAEEADLPQA